MLQNGDATYSYPLSSWVYHEKLRQLELIVQLGFELEVYSPEEYPGMYWYLSHLCSTHIAHLERIRMFVVAARKRTLHAPSTVNNNNSNNNNSVEVSVQNQAFAQTIRVLDRHMSVLLATEALALALHALYALLLRHQLLHSASSKSPYSSERLRYELRMKPFIPITLPEPVQFEAFNHEALLADDSDAAVLERATAAAAEARRAWEAVLGQGPFLHSPNRSNNSDAGNRSAIVDEWQGDVKNTLRSCIAASIALGTLRASLGPGTTSGGASSRSASTKSMSTKGHPILRLKVEVPEIGSSGRWHNWWLVPRITELKS